MLLFTGNVPRGVFCEQSSQKTRELSLRSKRYFLCLSQEGSSFCASRPKEKSHPFLQAGFFSQLILNHTKLFLVVFLFLFLSLRSSFFLNFKSQLVQLCFAYALRCLSHQTGCIFYLRECNYVTNAVNLGNEHNQTVKTVS